GLRARRSSELVDKLTGPTPERGAIDAAALEQGVARDDCVRRLRHAECPRPAGAVVWQSRHLAAPAFLAESTIRTDMEDVASTSFQERAPGSLLPGMLD